MSYDDLPLVMLRRKANKKVSDVAKALKLSDQQYRKVEHGNRALEGFRVPMLALALNLAPSKIPSIVEVVPEKTFGERIAAQGMKAGLEQREVASKLNVGPLQVSRWEKGHAVPPLARVEELARIFGCSISDLTDAADEGASDGMAQAICDKFAQVPESEKVRAFSLVMGLLSGFMEVPTVGNDDDPV